MKSCPHCKHIVTFHYDKYRCGYCSVWLGPDEVLSDTPDLSPARGNTDSIPTEAQRRASNHAVDKLREQILIGQNRSDSQD